MSLYIERAFLPNEIPDPAQIEAYEDQVIKELQEWGMIEEAEAVDTTRVDVAYTWSWPNSNWIEEAINLLAEQDIIMMGRYGRWHFQGIAASLREGLHLAV